MIFEFIRTHTSINIFSMNSYEKYFLFADLEEFNSSFRPQYLYDIWTHQ
jgi:hypothetical protein